MKTSIYSNRYRDQIKFEQLSEDEIKMTGYSNHFRVSYPNLYAEAYSAYLEDCKKIEEPDYDMLVDDPAQNRVRELTLKEFKKAVHDYRPEIRENPLAKYQPLIKSDMTRVYMVDPSGGPYLQIGSDIGIYFNGEIGKKYITEIRFNPEPCVIFTVSKTKPEED